MRIKKILLLLVIVDLLLLIQIVASARSTQKNDIGSVHRNLNDFVQSKGFRKYKYDHFPKICGEVNAIVTIRNRAIVNIQIEKSSIRNQQFLNAFTNFLLSQKLSLSTNFSEFDHQFSINRY